MKLDLLLRLGDNRLYEKSTTVLQEDMCNLAGPIHELHRIILEYRSVHGSGRAVAAPQMGLQKRIVCWNVDGPVTMINPGLSEFSNEMMELWDDCMCFPGLYIRVKRHLSCTLSFLDEKWKRHEWHLHGASSELIQHEVDHLDGILATQRALDDRSFSLFRPSEVY